MKLCSISKLSKQVENQVTRNQYKCKCRNHISLQNQISQFSLNIFIQPAVFSRVCITAREIDLKQENK